MNHLQVVTVAIVEVSMNIQNTLFQKLRDACNFFGYGTIECHIMGIIVIARRVKIGIKPDGEYVMWSTSVELKGEASSVEIANSHIGASIGSGKITESNVNIEVMNIMCVVVKVIDPTDTNSNLIRLRLSILACQSGWTSEISDNRTVSNPRLMRKIIMRSTIPLTDREGMESLEVEATFEKNPTNKTYKYWVKFNSCSPVLFVGTESNIHRHANDWLVSLKQSSAERFRVFNERYFVEE